MKSLIFACTLLVVKVNSDLIDQATQDLEELRIIVEGDIMVAHNDLDGIRVDFLIYAGNNEQSGRLSLEEAHQTFRQEVQLIKDLSWVGGKDPTACSDTRLQVLDLMMQDYRNTTSSCIHYQNNEERGIIRDARYLIDVAITKVHDLDFQLNRCNGQILCVSPLLSEINLDIIRLPQKIRTEVSAALTLSLSLRVKVKDCAEHRVAQYAAEGTNIVLAVSQCVTNLLDGSKD